VSAHRAGPSALGGAEAPPRAGERDPLAAAEAAAPAAVPATAVPEPPPAAPAAAADPDRDAELEFDLELDADADLDADLEPEPGPEACAAPAAPQRPRAVVPLSAEASRVVLARSLSREGMRADPSPRLARAAEVSIALHLELDGPPLRVRAHVEPGEDGPWLRFKDLTPAELERLDALLAGLCVFAGGDGPEHALAVCEILETHGG
jgi:hypothetical protein